MQKVTKQMMIEDLQYLLSRKHHLRVDVTEIDDSSFKIVFQVGGEFVVSVEDLGHSEIKTSGPEVARFGKVIVAY